MSQERKNLPETAAAIGDKAKEALELAKERGGEYWESGSEKAREYADRAKDKAGEYWESGSEKAREYAHRAKDKAGEYRDQTEAYVQENPLQSVAIAAGIGAAVASLFLVLTRRK